MINIKSGEISLDDLIIGRSSSQGKIQAFTTGKFSSSSMGRSQLSLGTHVKDGKRWGVGVIFIGSKLSQVWLQQLNAPGVDDGAWNLDNEKRRKVAHDQFVVRLCAGEVQPMESPSAIEYKFPWGKISSVLDIRGVQSLLVVEYL